MNSLIEIIRKAIAVLRGLLGSTSGLQAELNIARNTIAAQETIITNLKQLVNADQVDDAALEAAVLAARDAVVASEAKYNALAEELAGVQVAAAELADLITEEPSTPNVTSDFVVLVDQPAAGDPTGEDGQDGPDGAVPPVTEATTISPETTAGDPNGNTAAAEQS